MGSGGQVDVTGRWCLLEELGLNEASGPLCFSAGGKSAAVSPFDPHCVAEGGSTPPRSRVLNN